MFSHIGGVTKTHALPPKGPSPSDIYCQSLLDDLVRKRDALIEERERRSAQQAHARDVAERNRKILIENGMNALASDSDQAEFESMYRRMAKSDADAYFEMGEACYYGKSGAVEDRTRAFRCYLTADSKGCQRAEYSIGYCYVHGDGVAKNLNKGKAYLNRAASHGSSAAKSLLQKINDEEERKRAREWYAQIETERKNTIDECVKNGGLDPNATDRAKTLFMAVISMAEDDLDSQRKLGEWFESGVCGALKDLSRSLYWYLKAAKQGDPVAEYKVGYMLYFGKGVEENEPEAFKWFEQAAKKDNPDGMCRLGECYCNGRGCTKNDEEGFKWYLKAAEKGVGLAQVNVGRLFYKGIGISVDYDKAFKWFTEAAEKAKRADAYYWLGRCYEEGRGTGTDIYKSLKWYKKAADSDNKDGKTAFARKIADVESRAKDGDARAANALGVAYYNGDVYAKDYKAAARWFLAAAEGGNSDGQCNVGEMYRDGEGVEKDAKLAALWFVRAANNGHKKGKENLAKVALSTLIGCAQFGNADVEYEIARRYQNGIGEEKVVAKAREWYKKSAEQGLALAQFELAKILYFGKGIEEDYVSAVSWFEKAAAQGHSGAWLFLGTCYKNGYGVEKDLFKAFELYSKAANEQREAKYWLGKFYEKGWGVEKDPVTSFGWYEKAAEGGDVDAMCALAWAYQRGDGVEQNYSKAAEWFGKGMDKGDGVCTNNLARLYEDGKGVERDLGKALELFEKASENKCNRAYYHLGRSYENGLGVDVDLSKAKEYYAKAAESGDEDAKAALARI